MGSLVNRNNWKFSYKLQRVEIKGRDLGKWKFFYFVIILFSSFTCLSQSNRDKYRIEKDSIWEIGIKKHKMEKEFRKTLPNDTLLFRYEVKIKKKNPVCLGDTINYNILIVNGNIEDLLYLKQNGLDSLKFSLPMYYTNYEEESYELMVNNELIVNKTGMLIIKPFVYYKNKKDSIVLVKDYFHVHSKNFRRNFESDKNLYFEDDSIINKKKHYYKLCKRITKDNSVNKLDYKSYCNCFISDLAGSKTYREFNNLLNNDDYFKISNKTSPIYSFISYHMINNVKRKTTYTEKGYKKEQRKLNRTDATDL